MMINATSPNETRLNYLTAVLFVALLTVSIYGLMTLPDRIPVHFGIDGRANGWGKPTSLLILPGLCLFMLAMFWWTSRFAPTELMNFPGPRTPENVARQMQNIRQMSTVMRVLMTAFFLALISQWVWAAAQPESGISPWLVFGFVGVITATVAVFLVRAYRMVAK